MCSVLFRTFRLCRGSLSDLFTLALRIVESVLREPLKACMALCCCSDVSSFYVCVMQWPWYFVFPPDRVEVFYGSRAMGYTWPLPSHSSDTSPWVQIELADGRRLQTKLLVTKLFISVDQASSLAQVLSTGFGSDSVCAAPPTWRA